jgi:hypothetical protein
MMNVKGATYTLALTIASVVAARVGAAGASAEVPAWLSLTLAEPDSVRAPARKCIPQRTRLEERRVSRDHSRQSPSARFAL